MGADLLSSNDIFPTRIRESNQRDKPEYQGAYAQFDSRSQALENVQEATIP